MFQQPLGSKRSILTAKQTGLHPVVAVPARNEADRLPSLLEALACQTWLERPNRRLDVILVLNNCDDASADVAEAVRPLFPSLRLEVVDVVLAPWQAHVGWARRVAMDRACARAASCGVLVSTDADALPAPNWIDATLDAITAGADLVGGQITGNKAEEAALGAGFVRRAVRHLEYAQLADRLFSLMLPRAHDPWPRHADHTGASLAIRSEVYAALGGIPPLPFREDVALVAKAVAAGYRLRHPLDVTVRVSARLHGRARGGMADCLKAWVAAEAAAQPHLVEAPQSIFARLAAAQEKRCSRDYPEVGLVGIAGDLVVPGVADTDVDAAITHIRQLIADREGAIHVR